LHVLIVGVEGGEADSEAAVEEARLPADLVAFDRLGFERHEVENLFVLHDSVPVRVGRRDADAARVEAAAFEAFRVAGVEIVVRRRLEADRGAGRELLEIGGAGEVGLKGDQRAAAAEEGRAAADEHLAENVGRALVPGIAATERDRSEEHTSELQSLMRISYAVFCLKKKTT